MMIMAVLIMTIVIIVSSKKIIPSPNGIDLWANWSCAQRLTTPPTEQLIDFVDH
jgi:hypothetical protein